MENGERRQSVKVKLPWGGEVELRGFSVLITLSFALLCLIAYAIWIGDSERKQETDSIKTLLKELASRQTDTTEAQRELNYIITLPERQRAELRLQMPDSLRRRLRDSDE